MPEDNVHQARALLAEFPAPAAGIMLQPQPVILDFQELLEKGQQFRRAPPPPGGSEGAEFPAADAFPSGCHFRPAPCRVRSRSVIRGHCRATNSRGETGKLSA